MNEVTCPYCGRKLAGLHTLNMHLEGVHADTPEGTAKVQENQERIREVARRAELEGDQGDEEDDASGDFLWGGIFLVGGVGVTIGTYAAAAPGGTYIVTWGAIAYGGFLITRGLFRSASG